MNKIKQILCRMGLHTAGEWKQVAHNQRSMVYSTELRATCACCRRILSRRVG